ncbi:zinc finger, C3HC4 type-domain-containing protein [Cokeromyces recurvatus]|uniref:zinc finger, C3HC4 type-domain-containing protein n=1 Tax=Cokeromyces recurvatus TaxID=90255 RepID=UPI00221F4569|nr:zinc finger, C3HC4 type-domain-containing protein [Cokeromyces recurvatus]KAI7901667.1 zinc finger, C3HC4 type-domain-containing protein [Cokeromyces recurvatus]
MIKAKIDPSSLSVRTLKSILKSNFVEQSHVIEKSELVKLVQRLVDQYKADHTSQNNETVKDDNLCRICFDAQQNCVFLDCGHMVTCMDCAKKLIETNNQCPICREPILKLVHVFRS